MKSCLSISKTVYLLLYFYFSDKNALDNFTLAKMKMLPNGEMTSNITTMKHSSFLGKLFGKKHLKSKNIKKKQKDAESVYDIINNPGRFKRLTNDNPFSDFTQPYDFKKSTLPIIMDTTTSTTSGKKHLGYVDIQPKTTMMAVSSKMSNKRNKFKTFLNKILHKKQKEKQKRDALVKLHRELRFSPFKKLKEMFQISTSKEPSTKLKNDSPITVSNKVFYNKEKTISDVEKLLQNTFENHLPVKGNGMTTFSFEVKNIFPTEDFGGFKIENNLNQNNWKPHKDDIDSQLKSEEIATNYPTPRYESIFIKTNDNLENTESKNKKMSYNKFQNEMHQLTTDNRLSNSFGFGFNFDSSDLPPGFNLKPFTQFSPAKKKYPSAKNAKFDLNRQLESNANFDLHGKYSKLQANSKYSPINTYYAKNNEVPKYGNNDDTEPRSLESNNYGYSIPSIPLWQHKDSHYMDNKLDESRVHNKADTGKLNIAKKPTSNVMSRIFGNFPADAGFLASFRFTVTSNCVRIIIN